MAVDLGAKKRMETNDLSKETEDRNEEHKTK